VTGKVHMASDDAGFRKRGYATPMLAFAGIRVRGKGRADDAYRRRLVADIDDSLVG
jgi:hypothetical protein